MPFGGATLRFGRVAGHANAMRYLLTADSFDAQEAHRLGLVTEVVAVGEQLERAMALAERISAQAPLAVQATLASARANPETEAAEIMPRLGALLRTKDVQRGLEAFMTRQPAKFEGN